MHELGYLDDAEYEAAVNEPLVFVWDDNYVPSDSSKEGGGDRRGGVRSVSRRAGLQRRGRRAAPREELFEEIAKKLLYTGGYQIYATIDPELQSIVERSTPIRATCPTPRQGRAAAVRHDRHRQRHGQHRGDGGPRRRARGPLPLQLRDRHPPLRQRHQAHRGLRARAGYRRHHAGDGARRLSRAPAGERERHGKSVAEELLQRLQRVLSRSRPRCACPNTTAVRVLEALSPSVSYGTS